MRKEEAVSRMTDVMVKFVAFTGKRLPDDVREKIAELAKQEEEPLAKAIYETMERNQELAMKLNRPSCQDTGALQFFINCGSEFPYMAELPALLRQAV
ncbi:MAG: fumarate hydratase, partial [Mitsuokella sp.]|uniref:fumarate hydratase n=1 Tax=Mitsuokella sp. TaxID=2049034 RepID=UPI003F09C39C